MKTCSACRQTKPLLDFLKNRAQKDGLDNQCVLCARLSKSKWKKANKDKYNAQQQRAYAKNTLKGQLRLRKYRAENRALTKAQVAKCRAARLKRTPPWLTEAHYKQIELFYGAAASLTKELGIKFHVDHIMPLCGKDSSGLHVPWNLQVITALENLKKGNKIL